MRLIRGVRVVRQPAVRPFVSSMTDQMVGVVADAGDGGVRLCGLGKLQRLGLTG